MNVERFRQCEISHCYGPLVGNKYWSHQELAVRNRGQTHHPSETKLKNNQYLSKPNKFTRWAPTIVIKWREISPLNGPYTCKYQKKTSRPHPLSTSIHPFLRAFSWFSGHDNVTIFKHLASARQCAKGLPSTSIQSSPCWALAVTSKARKLGELAAAAAKRRLKSSWVLLNEAFFAKIYTFAP